MERRRPPGFPSGSRRFWGPVELVWGSWKPWVCLPRWCTLCVCVCVSQGFQGSLRHCGGLKWGARSPVLGWGPPPSHSQLLTWGEGAGGDRESRAVSGGDKSWGQKYTESRQGVGGRGDPPTQPHCWGAGETPESLPPLWCFPGGKGGSSEMARLQMWKELPGCLGGGGVEGGTGEDGEGKREGL